MVEVYTKDSSIAFHDATRWGADESGQLLVFDQYGKCVGQFASKQWKYVLLQHKEVLGDDC